MGSTHSSPSTWTRSASGAGSARGWPCGARWAARRPSPSPVRPRSDGEVRERIETLGPAGLVLCPAYDIDEPDMPWANVEAFLEAGAEWGVTRRS